MRFVEENTTAGTIIGLPVTARDADNDSLTYTISGADGSSFDIDGSTGQLKTKAALDYESAKNSYTVTVTATDPSDENDTIEVTIDVTNVEEPPGKPEAPTVTPAETNGHDALTLTWTAPTNAGPDITSYAVQYRKHDVQEWTDVTGPIAGTTATVDISDLLPDTTYFARVQATSDEGTGEWSEEGEGTTAVTPDGQQVTLTVDYDAATYSVTEGSTVNITVDLSPEADRKLSIPITIEAGATNPAETGDYTLGGLDASNNLAFVPGEDSQTFTITANSDTDTDDETLTLGFDSPLPNKVTAGSQTAAVVTINDTTRRSNNPGSGGGGGGGGGGTRSRQPGACVCCRA